MKKIILIVGAVATTAITASAQVLLSGGLTYNQNFDSLPNTPVNGTTTWTDNSTLLGWYSSRAFTAGTTSAYGPYAYPSVRVGDGTTTSGWLYSFGVAGVNAVEERAIGSTSSGTPKTNIFGVLFQNDTAGNLGDATVSYTGEQWRNGGNTAAHKLAVSYQVFSSAVSSPVGVDSAPNNGWTALSALDFTSPTTGATAAALDGNAPANRTVFANVPLTGVVLSPGQQIFLRWLDIDDSGNDHGLGVDDFSITFAAVPEPGTVALAGLAALGFFLRRKFSR